MLFIYFFTGMYMYHLFTPLNALLFEQTQIFYCTQVFLSDLRETKYNFSCILSLERHLNGFSNVVNSDCRITDSNVLSTHDKHIWQLCIHCEHFHHFILTLSLRVWSLFGQLLKSISTHKGSKWNYSRLLLPSGLRIDSLHCLPPPPPSVHSIR